jgi:hypothetical protein
MPMSCAVQGRLAMHLRCMLVRSDCRPSFLACEQPFLLQVPIRSLLELMDRPLDKLQTR